MIEVGKYQNLKMLRQTSVGFYLGDDGEEDILLPNKYCPEEFEQNEEIRVFVYRDHEDRKIATNLRPKLTLGEFAFLKVAAVDKVGAFMDWGLEKELLVPFSEQRQTMEVNRWYVVQLKHDEKTDRLFASNKIEKNLDKSEPELNVGQEVNLLIYHSSNLGYSAIVENRYKGLLYLNEVHQELRIGEKLSGYIKKIREDGKIDLSIQPIGYLEATDSHVQLILSELHTNGGKLELTDKSSPEEIQRVLGISKKAFKRAVGALYKQKQIVLTDDSIKFPE